MNYEMFTNSVIEIIKNRNLWDRVVSLDLETKVLGNQNVILTGERILGIGVARRFNKKVEIKTFVLKDDSDDAELELIRELGDYFYQIRPIIVLGFGIGTYDHSLMIIKVRRLDEWFKKMKSEGKNIYYPGYWAIRDAFTRGYILDMINPIRFEIANHDGTTPKFISLEKTVTHPRFAHLPLKRTKGIVISTENFEDKGKMIYELWKNDKEKFKEYLEGDVHDPLLIAEDIFKVKI